MGTPGQRRAAGGYSPGVRKPSPASSKRHRRSSRGRDVGGADLAGGPFLPWPQPGKKALARHYHGRGVARFEVYELTMFTWFPEVRRAIRAAGWAYEPGKKGK